MSLKLLLVDDHKMLSIGLKTFIEANSDFKVIETLSESKETLVFLENAYFHQNELFPEIIIFDIQLEKELSFDLISAVNQKYPSIKLIVYSMFDSTGYILLAKKRGVSGYISKASDCSLVIECLNKVAGGEEFFKVKSIDKLESIQQAILVLTKKEKQVFEYILMGKNNQEISEIMNIKIHSVENYTCSIYEKLGIHYKEEIFERYM